MRFFVYILKNIDNKLYIGQTNNLERRIAEHGTISTKSAKYIRDHKNFTLVYFESYESRSDSMSKKFSLKNGVEQ